MAYKPYKLKSGEMIIASPAMHHPKLLAYKGQMLKENPLTGDWLVSLPDPYGSYFGTLAGVKDIVNRYLKHSKV